MKVHCEAQKRDKAIIILYLYKHIVDPVHNVINYKSVIYHQILTRQKCGNVKLQYLQFPNSLRFLFK
jgi:hypothetical protein